MPVDPNGPVYLSPPNLVLSWSLDVGNLNKEEGSRWLPEPCAVNEKVSPSVIRHSPVSWHAVCHFAHMSRMGGNPLMPKYRDVGESEETSESRATRRAQSNNVALMPI